MDDHFSWYRPCLVSSGFLFFVLPACMSITEAREGQSRPMSTFDPQISGCVSQVLTISFTGKVLRQVLRWESFGSDMRLPVPIRLRICVRCRQFLTFRGRDGFQASNRSHDQRHYPEDLAGEGDCFVYTLQCSNPLQRRSLLVS